MNQRENGRAFSGHVSIFGNYEDTSMAAARRREEREMAQKTKAKQRREESMMKLNEQFEEEVAKVKAIQKTLKFRQKVMARLVLELYSSIVVQCAWRKYKASKVLQHLKVKRFIKDWFRYHFFYRKLRRKAAFILVRWYKFRRRAHIATVYEKIVKSQNRIYRWYRRRKFSIALRRRINLLAFRTRIVNRAIIFGETRAANKIRKARIDASERSPRRIASCGVLARFFRKILLRRRIQILHSYLYCGSLRTFDIKKYRDSKKPKQRSEQPDKAGEVLNTVSGRRGLRSSPAVTARDKRMSPSRGVNAKENSMNRQETTLAMPDEPGNSFVPCRASYLEYTEVILFILSRLTATHQKAVNETKKAKRKEKLRRLQEMQFVSSTEAVDASDTFLTGLDVGSISCSPHEHDDHGGDSDEDGGEPYTDTVFSYLVKERERFFDELEKAKHQDQFLQAHQRNLLRDNILLGNYKNRLLDAHTREVQRKQEIRAPLATQGVKQSRRSLIGNTKSGPVRNSRHSRIEQKDRSAARGPIEGQSDDMGIQDLSHDHFSSLPPLPKEMLGIYRPISMYEIVMLVWELRAMAIAMPSDVWNRIIHGDERPQLYSHRTTTDGHSKAGPSAETLKSEQPSGDTNPSNTKGHSDNHNGHDEEPLAAKRRRTESNTAPYQEFTMAKGLPSQRALYQYLFFTSTERIPVASKCCLVEVFERRFDAYKWAEFEDKRKQNDAKNEKDKSSSPSHSRSRSPRKVKAPVTSTESATAITTASTVSNMDSAMGLSASHLIQGPFSQIPLPRDPTLVLGLKFYSIVTRKYLHSMGIYPFPPQQMATLRLAHAQGQTQPLGMQVVGASKASPAFNNGLQGTGNMTEVSITALHYLAYYSSPKIRPTAKFYNSDGRSGLRLKPIPLAVEVFAPEVLMLKNKESAPKTKSPSKTATEQEGIAKTVSSVEQRRAYSPRNSPAKKKGPTKEQRRQALEGRLMSQEESRSLANERALRRQYERESAAAAAVIEANKAYTKMAIDLVSNIVVGGVLTAAMTGAMSAIEIEKQRRMQLAVLEEEMEARCQAEEALKKRQRRKRRSSDSDSESDSDDDDESGQGTSIAASDDDDDDDDDEEEEEEGSSTAETENTDDASSVGSGRPLRRRDVGSSSDQHNPDSGNEKLLFPVVDEHKDPAAEFLNEASRTGKLAGHVLPDHATQDMKEDHKGTRSVTWPEEDYRNKGPVQSTKHGVGIMASRHPKEQSRGMNDSLSDEEAADGADMEDTSTSEDDEDEDGEDEDDDHDDDDSSRHGARESGLQPVKEGNEDQEDEEEDTGQAEVKRHKHKNQHLPGSALETSSVDNAPVVGGLLAQYTSLSLSRSLASDGSVPGLMSPGYGDATHHGKHEYSHGHDASHASEGSGGGSKTPSIVLYASPVNFEATHRPGKVMPLTPQMQSFARSGGSDKSIEDLVRSGGHSSPIHSADVSAAAAALAHAVKVSSEKDLKEGMYNSDFTRKMALSLRVQKAVQSSAGKFGDIAKQVEKLQEGDSDGRMKDGNEGSNVNDMAGETLHAEKSRHDDGSVHEGSDDEQDEPQEGDVNDHHEDGDVVSVLSDLSGITSPTFASENPGAPKRATVMKKTKKKKTTTNKVITGDKPKGPAKKTLNTPSSETPSKVGGLNRTPSKAGGLNRTPSKASGLNRTPSKASGLNRTPSKASNLTETPSKSGLLKSSSQDGIAMAYERHPVTPSQSNSRKDAESSEASIGQGDMEGPFDEEKHQDSHDRNVDIKRSGKESPLAPSTPRDKPTSSAAPRRAKLSTAPGVLPRTPVRKGSGVSPAGKSNIYAAASTVTASRGKSKARQKSVTADILEVSPEDKKLKKRQPTAPEQSKPSNRGPRSKGESTIAEIPLRSRTSAARATRNLP